MDLSEVSIVLKKIEEYVDKVYRHAKGDAQEINDLKMEMKSHLIETVEELKSEGFSEDEAIRMAKERFGEVNELRAQVSEMIQTQKSFGRRILYVALSLVLISIALFGAITAVTGDQASDQADIAYQIADIASGKESLSTDDINEIEELTRDASYITKVHVFNTNGLNGNYNTISSDPIYEMEQEAWRIPLLTSTYNYGAENSFVVLEATDYHTLAFLTLFAGMASAFTLLIIHLIIGMHQRRKRNIH